MSPGEETPREYATACLDTAAWLGANDYRFLRIEVSSYRSNRVRWIFEDPGGDAERMAAEFNTSLSAKVLQSRKTFLTLAKNRQQDGQKRVRR